MTSRFKRVSDNNPDMMVPSMEGDIIYPVDLPIEEFTKIADQVYEYINDSLNL